MVDGPCSHQARRRFRPIAEPLLIAALALLATGASVRNGFVWEDDRLILRSRALRDMGSAWLFLDPQYWREEHISAGTAYRPVRELSFAADAALWGGWAGGFHLTNVTLHAANSVFVYGLTTSLFGAGSVPLAAAALFAVHPLNTEAVAWIKNRGELLGFLFFMVAWLTFWKTRRGAYAVALLAFLFALMSKGSAAVLCAILTVQGLLTRDQRNGHTLGRSAVRLWRISLPGSSLKAALQSDLVAMPPRREKPAVLWRTLPFWGLAILAVGFQMWMAAGEQGALAIGAWQQAVSSASALARYVGAMAFPFGLNVLHDVPSPKGTLGLETLAPVALVVLWIAAAILLARRNAAWCVALVWPLMALLPAANTALLRDRPFAEQRAYLATGAFCLVLAAVAATRRDAWPWMRAKSHQLLGRSAPTMSGLRPRTRGSLKAAPQNVSDIGRRACVVIAVLFLGASTLERIHDWRDNRSLWTDASRKTPGEPKAHFNLGVAYGNVGEFGKAAREFRRAVNLRPTYATAWHSLGMLCRMAGRLDEAAAHLTESLRLSPNSPEAHNSLGIVLSESGRPERAVAEFQAALKLKPTFLEVWQNLGLTYEKMGQDSDALDAYRKALGLTPSNDARVRCAMGDILMRAGRAAEAAAEYEAATRADPTYAPAREGLRSTRRGLSRE